MDWQEKLADRYERSYDIADDEVCDLLNNECDPYKPDNIVEAIVNVEVLFQNGGLEQMADLMERRELHHLGRMVFDRIVSYWESQAEEIAVERHNSSIGDER